MYFVFSIITSLCFLKNARISFVLYVQLFFFLYITCLLIILDSDNLIGHALCDANVFKIFISIIPYTIQPENFEVIKNEGMY